MRKVLLAAMLAMSTIACNAQTARHSFYCRISGRVTASGKVNNWIEWGEEKKTVHLKDEKERKINFNNTVDFLNYMSERGWVFVAAINQESSVDFLLKKDASSYKEAKEGLRFDTDK